MPLDDATLAEVIQRVLVRPMTTTEGVVAVVEAGYRSTMKRTALRNHVTRVLTRRCVSDGAKWGLG